MRGKAAVSKVLNVTWQRCRMHFMRNVQCASQMTLATVAPIVDDSAVRFSAFASCIRVPEKCRRGGRWSRRLRRWLRAGLNCRHCACLCRLLERDQTIDDGLQSRQRLESQNLTRRDPARFNQSGNRSKRPGAVAQLSSALDGRSAGPEKRRPDTRGTACTCRPLGRCPLQLSAECLADSASGPANSRAATFVRKPAARALKGSGLETS